jgi:transposase
MAFRGYPGGTRIVIPSTTRVLVATKPVDFRKGPDGLAALVRDAGGDPFSGALYVFRSKRADRLKIIWWDGTGLVLFAKRLEEDRFRWPRLQDGVIKLSAAQLMALVDGMEWTRVHALRPRRPQSVG